MIPKVIHQIYLSGALPPALQANVDALKALNPGWEHRLYDAAAADAFIAANYEPRVLTAYNRIDPRYGAARSDLLRHLLIYRAGGVYLDIKSSFDVPLDTIIRPDDAYLLSQWRNGPGEAEAGFGLHRDLSNIPGGEYQMFFIIAEPGHPFSRAVIDRIVGNIAHYWPGKGVGRIGVLRTTGPIAYTRAIHPIRDAHPHRLVDIMALGASWSLRGGYDHNAAFPTHYSNHDFPVVKQGHIGNAVNAGLNVLRALKQRLAR